MTLCGLCMVDLVQEIDVWVEHLLRYHKQKMIDEILVVYPVYSGLCVVEPCSATLRTIPEIRAHLNHHTRGLVTAWVEARMIGNFVKSYPSFSRYPRKTSLKEFFWK